MALRHSASRIGLRLAPPGVAAIDIRDGVVHFEHLSGAGGKPSHAIFRQEAIDPSLNPGAPIAATAAAISRAAGDIDLSRTPTAIVLSNNCEGLRVKRFPRMKKKALASAIDIAHTSGSILEGAAKRSRHFVQASGAGDDGQRFVEVVLVEATAAAVDDAERLSRGADLRLAHVSSAALALGRALRASGDAKGTVLVVDLVGPATVLNSYTDGRFLLSREADVAADLTSDELGSLDELLPPGGAIDAAAAPLLDAMGLAGHAASETAIEAGTATATALAASDDAEASLAALGDISPQKLRIEIVRSNRYLASHYRRPIERVFFAGPAREARVLANRLAPGLGVPIAILDPRSVVGADAIEGEPSCASARCLGAALELLAPARSRGYQFLNPKKGLRRGLLHPAYAAAAVFLMLVAGSLAAVRGRTARADATLARLRGELRAATEALVIPSAQLDPAQVETRLAVYRMLRDGQPRWSPPLAALASLVPDDVWLTGVALEAGDADDLPSMEEILAGIGGSHVDAAATSDAGGAPRLVLTGRTYDLAAVSRFLERLAASEVLQDARVLSVAPAEPEVEALDVSAASADDAHASGRDLGARVTNGSRRRPPYEFAMSVAPSLHLRGNTAAESEVAR